METAIYTLNEVNKHQGRESCWIAIHGKVYDVTKYLDQHPAGPEEILGEAGTDATKAFVEIGHSSDAKEILETLVIGSLHPDDVKAIARKNQSIPWAKITAVAAIPIAVTVITAFILFNRK